MDRNEIKDRIYRMVASSHKRMKPGDLAKTLARSLGVDKKEVKSAISELTEEGRLVYSYTQHNYLELPPPPPES